MDRTDVPKYVPQDKDRTGVPKYKNRMDVSKCDDRTGVRVPK